MSLLQCNDRQIAMASHNMFWRKRKSLKFPCMPKSCKSYQYFDLFLKVSWNSSSHEMSVFDIHHIRDLSRYYTQVLQNIFGPLRWCGNQSIRQYLLTGVLTWSLKRSGYLFFSQELLHKGIKAWKKTWNV